MNRLSRAAAHHVRDCAGAHRRRNSDLVLTPARRARDARRQRDDRADATCHDERADRSFLIDFSFFLERQEHSRNDAARTGSRRGDDDAHPRVLAHHR